MKMNKILTVFLIIMMMLSMLPHMDRAAAVTNEDVLFSEDFENKTDWVSLSNDGWTSPNGAPVTIVTEDTNRYVNIATPWGSGLSKVFVQPLTGLYNLEMDLAVNYPSISHFGFIDANNTIQNLLYFNREDNKNKLIFAPSWTPLSIELDDGEWVKIKLSVNTVNNSCTMWITKAGQSQQLVFLNYKLNTLYDGLNGIVFNYPMYYPNLTGKDFKLDNVRFYRPSINYQLNGNLTVNGKNITSSSELYAHKNSSPQIKITVLRDVATDAITGNVYYALYQNQRLIDIKTAYVSLKTHENQKEIVLSMDLSRVSSSNLTVNLFFWKTGSQSPITKPKKNFRKPTQIYVSKKDGDDINSGDIDFPVKTIQKAKMIARNYKNNEVVILIREGDYTENISFDGEDARQAEYHLTVQNYENEFVRIIGATALNSVAFTNISDEKILNVIPEVARSKVKQLSLGSQGISEYGEIIPINYGETSVSPPELFINETAMTLARWPNNNTYAEIGAVVKQTAESFTFTVESNQNRAKNWVMAKDAWLYGFWYWDWLNEGIKLKEVNPQTGEVTASRNTQVRAGQRFYIYNLPEELDHPGEFYLDRDTGILYVYPLKDIKSTDDILLSLNTNPLIKLTNTANIHIKGLEIGYTRERGIATEYTDAVTIEKCKVHFTGQVGIQATEATNLIIKDCIITQTGAGGILSSGGDTATLTPSNNLFTNNHIYRFSRLIKSYTPALRIAGVGSIISHNLIHDAEHIAILYNGNDHVMEYNEIYNVCTDTDDSGAIYTGQKWNDRGNIVQYNYLHDITGPSGGYGVNGVYLDDVHSSTRIYGNIFYKVSRPILIGGGRDNVINNNIILEATAFSTASLVIDQRGVEKWFSPNVNEDTGMCYQNLRSVPYQSVVWRDKYPALYTILENSPKEPRGNVVKNNIIYMHKEMEVSPLAFIYGEFSNNFITDTENIGFEDYENRNYKLKENSVVFEHIPEFQQIPVENIGIIKK